MSLWFSLAITLPLQGGGPRFESGQAHSFFFGFQRGFFFEWIRTEKTTRIDVPLKAK